MLLLLFLQIWWIHRRRREAVSLFKTQKELLNPRRRTRTPPSPALNLQKEPCQP